MKKEAEILPEEVQGDPLYVKYFEILEKEILPYENFLHLYIDKLTGEQMDALFAYITKNYKEDENYKKPPHSLLQDLYFSSLMQAKTTLGYLLEDAKAFEDQESYSSKIKECFLFVMKSNYFSIRKIFIGK